MGAMKDFIMESAYLYQENHPFLTFDEAQNYVMGDVHDIEYWRNYNRRCPAIYGLRTSAPIRKIIHFRTRAIGKAQEIAERIHKQLAGNSDYKDSRIILNFGRNYVRVYIFEDSKTTPNIQIMKED